MKTFSIHPSITEYETFKDFAADAGLGESDLIFTNEFIYDPFIRPANLPCPALFQERYGQGEPTDEMIDAIRMDFPAGIKRVIAVGGGTVIDIAKLLILEPVSDQSLPSKGLTEAMVTKAVDVEKTKTLLCVPTTCGTGSEVTNVAITALLQKQTKMGLALDCMYPDKAVLVPEMIATLPYKFFATSSVDAMVHCVESFLSPKATDYSAIFSIQGIKTIVAHYRQVVQNGLETWSDHAAAFLKASNYGGIAFGNAGCAAVHALSYPLSGQYHIPHGEANMLMFEAVIRKYIEKQPVGRINELEDVLAEAFDTDTTEGIWDRLFQLLNDILKRNPLNHYGIKESDLEVFTESVIAGQQRLLVNNYVELDHADMMDIYRSCYDS